MRRHFENRFPGQPIAWRGGTLCFLKSGEVVPGSAEIPKRGSSAIGCNASGAQKLPVIPTFDSGGNTRREFGEGGFYGYHPMRRSHPGDDGIYGRQAKHPTGNHRTGAYVGGRL